MTTPDPRAARLLPICVVAFAATVMWAGPAAADPPPADPTAPAPLPATDLVPPASRLGNPLGQNGSEPTGPLGLPDLSAHGAELLLGQNPVPAPPGFAAPAFTPDLRAFNPQYLVPQNVTPAAPGQGTPAPGIGPSEDDPSLGRIAFLRRLHEMYGAGDLKGALLGQMPAEQLGEPLPGTAPGPGIYLPPGLGNGLPEPTPTLPPQA